MHWIEKTIHFDFDFKKDALDLSCESISTSYACLLINGRIITASTTWWELKPSESYLISLLCLTMSNSMTCSDIPIYLPHKNSSVNHYYKIKNLTAFDFFANMLSIRFWHFCRQIFMEKVLNKTEKGNFAPLALLR